MWKRFTQFITESIFRVFAAIFPPSGKNLPHDPKLILIFSTTGIGDALFDTAAVRSFRIAYPKSKIVVCAHRKRSTIFLHDPDVCEVVPYGKSPVYTSRLLRRFRRDRPDLVILLNINPEVVPIAYCINRRALFGGGWRCGNYGFLLSHGVPLPKEGHILRLGAAIARAAGGAEDVFTMVYQAKESEREALRERFAKWIDHPFVMFQTGGGRSRSWRDWPVDSYVRNIQWLQENYRVKVVLTGGWDNENAAQEIEFACPGVINLCNKTTLEETAALLTYSLMLVSTDTGVLFMSYATRCPALAILHYASPSTLIGPIGVASRDVGHEVVELPKPPGPLEQRHGEMGKIPDDEVREAIQRILARKGMMLTEGIQTPL
jgi:ADP-heptose:LPS heptosyltransferase